jgi:hypothetical protein
MEILIGLFIILLLAVGYVFKLALTYGGLKPFFSKEIKPDRVELAAARKKAKSLSKAAAGELKAANKVIDLAQKAYDKKVQLANSEYQSWLNPQDGRLLLNLGKVNLHEHTIHVNGKNLSLEGISVDTRITDSSAVLILGLPNGMKVTESFDTTWRDGATTYSTTTHKDYDIVESSTKKKRSFSPDQIIHLAGEINNQSVRHADFLQRRPEMIIQLATALEEISGDTRDLDSAKETLSALEIGSETAQESKNASASLVVAEAKYASIVAAKFGKKKFEGS